MTEREVLREHPDAHAESVARGYERADASVRPVFLFTLVLTIVCTVVILLMVVLFDYFDRVETHSDSAVHPMTTATEPPAPRLQTTNGDDLAANRERERVQLEQYAWVDRSSGVVRIPIERAMELVLERGLPARK